MDDDRLIDITPVTVLPDTTPGPPGGEPDRTVLRLKIALAATLAGALALAGALLYVRYQPDAEREATAAIAAYTRAWNAHDVGAVKKAMAGNGTFAASDALDRGTLFTAYIGPELDRVLSKLFAAGVRLKTPGRVTVAGDDPTRASIAQEYSYTVFGLTVHENGISHFTLGPVSEENRRLVVVQHIFWRPRTPGSPSMLWILES